MATVSPVSSATSSTSSDALPGSTRVPQKVLGRDDFMKLLAVQFQMQDPMKPMEDTAFIAQMAQFTSLEQTTQLNREFASLRASSELSSAGGLIGRQVTVLDSDNLPVTGIVSAVDNTTSTPRLVIDDVLYPYASVVRVEAAPVESATAPDSAEHPVPAP